MYELIKKWIILDILGMDTEDKIFWLFFWK